MVYMIGIRPTGPWESKSAITSGRVVGAATLIIFLHEREMRYHMFELQVLDRRRLRDDCVRLKLVFGPQARDHPGGRWGETATHSAGRIWLRRSSARGGARRRQISLVDGTTGGYIGRHIRYGA